MLIYVYLYDAPQVRKGDQRHGRGKLVKRDAGKGTEVLRLRCRRTHHRCLILI